MTTTTGTSPDELDPPVTDHRPVVPTSSATSSTDERPTHDGHGQQPEGTPTHDHDSDTVGVDLEAPSSRFQHRPPSQSRKLGMRHHEQHTGHRASWLRAGVLGANDGLLSTASLLVGVASASAGRTVLLATGVASVVAGAGSMAIGEYSSVSSQRDAEQADLETEAVELETMPRAELAELTTIYEHRGLPRAMAREVAATLTAHDALTAHARDELGLDPEELARPLEAAVTSAVSFALGALVPLLVVLAVGAGVRVPMVVGSALLGLAALGAFGAHLGGAPLGRPALRVLVGGAAAMGAAALIGQAFDVAVH